MKNSWIGKSFAAEKKIRNSKKNNLQIYFFAVNSGLSTKQMFILWTPKRTARKSSLSQAPNKNEASH